MGNIYHCDLGNHEVPWQSNTLIHVCGSCKKKAARTAEEISRQGELERQRKDGISPFRYIPYAGLAALLIIILTLIIT